MIVNATSTISLKGQTVGENFATDGKGLLFHHLATRVVVFIPGDVQIPKVEKKL
jgi:hypothetical protein